MTGYYIGEQSMKVIIIILAIVVAVLQYQLWFASNGVVASWKLKTTLAALNNENDKLQQANNAVFADIEDLKHGDESIEERARESLGMVRKGEKFYQLVQSR